MPERYKGIKDYANRNLSFPVVSYQCGEYDFGVTQGANNGRLRVIVLENGVLVKTRYSQSLSDATRQFEEEVKEFTKNHEA